MLNVEEKGPVPQNGHGLSNGIVNNKDSENTWDELDSAIDNELNSFRSSIFLCSLQGGLSARGPELG